MNKKLVLLGAAMLMTAGVASAQKRVTGQVLDADGNPLIGATVRVDGAKKVTMTDDNGRFILTDVPASAKTILVSYIGYDSQKVSVASNVKIVMKDNNVLDEAVVIGYGTARKLGTVVGSVKKVGGQTIAGKPTPNIADALQGKVAGLQISSNSGDVGSSINSTSIRLRGLGSLGAGSTPLLVIDGSPASMAMLSLMNDKDIESITTLKDASATSIYGSRAANGVIYVTTKKGRVNEKAQINISQSVGWSQLANSIGNPLSSDELLEFKLENGIINIDEFMMYKQHGANTNWQDYMFDNAAPMHNTDVSIRGGSGTTSYYVSGSFMQQDGITKVSHFDRYTLRTNLETKPKDWLSFGIKQNVTYTDRKSDGYSNGGSSNIYGNAVSMSTMLPPYWDPYDPESMKNNMIWGMNDYDVHYVKRSQPQKINDIIYNGVAYMQITPFKGLTLRSQLGLTGTDTRNSYKVLPSSPLAQNGIGIASESHGRSSMWTITNTAEYKFDLGKNHSFTLLAGQEGIKYDSKNFSASGKGTVDDKLSSLGNITIPDMPSYGSTKYEYLSFFGRADYSYKDKYYFNFTIRNDQSSRFGKDNRGANFYSGGVMWDVLSESFMDATRGWLSSLQVKTSVGSTGNSAIGDYSSLGLVSNAQYGAMTGHVLGTPENKHLGWEKQVQTNVGVTARFFDRLTLDLNAYHRKTTDMLMSVPLPSTTGFGARQENVGGLINNGFELELNLDVVRTRDAYLSVYANYSYNNNEIDELFNGLEELPDHNNITNYVVGKSINYFMPIYAGVDEMDGRPMWYKKGHKGGEGYTFNPETMTKEYSKELYQDTGKKIFNPHNGGFGFQAGWKGLSISADFSYALGKYMVDGDYLGSINSGNARSLFNVDRDFLSYWKKPGDKTMIPAMQYQIEVDTHTLMNASYMRMKNLTVAYDLPRNWMKATRFLENVRLSFTGRNLFTVTKYKGTDPELDSNFQKGNFPATRQFVLGVDITL